MMTVKSTVPPESGTDDARSADTERTEADRKRALETAREAERFWKERVETLSKDEHKRVEDFLPTINTP
ncbi:MULTISPECIES: hypothetical protein [Rhizobium]|jgi:hypothetical protein|uniref:Uncharacterized protein n=1 Tax=Rhizobium anhuiense TaxID=1184720 RepID=A0ABX4J4P2_9HYPH|nr:MULTISPECIES: hypothetical protein [Rhizobium]KZS56396.1 hypothetical protein AS890_00650 [Rhizobium anhuiense bv. trifolii]MBB3302409.1 hypothetical protein [Rhizobium sp. BK112]MBB3371457.1 hypothetical protein [Rhizobium sp. BK077]MBB3746628.1 hypothetical protein [Rhizobium sp. BK591]MBB4117289.1 hypothetical protein [Rhizobium sp. BK226]